MRGLIFSTTAAFSLSVAMGRGLQADLPPPPTESVPGIVPTPSPSLKDIPVSESPDIDMPTVVPTFDDWDLEAFTDWPSEESLDTESPAAQPTNVPSSLVEEDEDVPSPPDDSPSTPTSMPPTSVTTDPEVQGQNGDTEEEEFVSPTDRPSIESLTSTSTSTKPLDGSLSPWPTKSPTFKVSDDANGNADVDSTTTVDADEEKNSSLPSNTTVTTPDSRPTNDESTSLSSGENGLSTKQRTVVIVGAAFGVVGGVALCCSLTAFIVWLRLRRVRQRRESRTEELPSTVLATEPKSTKTSQQQHYEATMDPTMTTTEYTERDYENDPIRMKESYRG